MKTTGNSIIAKKNSPGWPGEILAVGIGYRFQYFRNGIIRQSLWCFIIRK